MENPKFSIIMPTYNSIHCLPNCLTSLFDHTEDFELIIVEDGSTDGTAGYLREIQKTRRMKVIYNAKHTCFSTINNQGIELATGEYIVFLNSDTILTKGWLKRIEGHFKNIPLKKVGMIGPVSNMSNGRQNVGQQDADQWYVENKGKWGHAGVLYGWCMVTKKSIIDEVGGFDERFDNAFEDNDLCLRIQLAGYKLVIAYDTYIQHLGQGSLRQIYTEDQYIENGFKNREKYHDKYATSGEKKLVAVYRVANCERTIRQSLEQTSKFADSIIVHLCRSTDRTEEIVREFPKVIKIQKYDGIFQEDYERNWLLQEALKLHEKGLADWCLSVDGDEIYEDIFIERVQKMMNPRNPEVMGYWCQWRTIWEKRLFADKQCEEFFRADGIFGDFTNYRFFKLQKGQEIYSDFHPEGHHCGSAPLIGPENLRWTNIRVKHLGYDTPEQRREKYTFYQEADHFKTEEDIGNKDYSHLIDTDVKLERYRKENGITLLMMIKDEETWIRECLEHVASIVDEYVIVDTGSKDKTLEIINDFAKHSIVPVKVLHYPWCDNYSIPRNFGKIHATKRWILHLDADERFRHEDLKVIFKMAETEAEVVLFHVINYFEKSKNPKRCKYASSESVRLFKNIPEFFYTGVIHETIDDSLGAMRIHREVRLMRSPKILHHYGYIREGGNKVTGKLEYYEKLNNDQIEVTEDGDPRPYFNLALHWLNLDDHKKALKAFQRALQINPRFWHASQQMAALNIENAKIFMRSTLDTMPQAHPYREEGTQILKYLDEHTFGYIKVGNNERNGG